MKRIIVLVLVVALAVPLAAVSLLTGSEDVQAQSQELPDLGIIRFNKSYTYMDTKSQPGKKLLRFDAIIKNNTDAGPFELRAKRATTSDPWNVVQRIYNSKQPTGSYTEVSTPTQMVYGTESDGHPHWHVRDIASYYLERLDNGSKVGTSAKGGFCFYDNVQSVSTYPKYYTNTTSGAGASCAKFQPNALEALMGLSSGWGDKYPHSLADQYIDITNLTAGRYRLVGVADEQGWFRESNDNNNRCTADVQITGTSVTLDTTTHGRSCMRKDR